MSRIRVASRRAFTLTEILVIISIVAVLMALTAGAVWRFAAGQQTSATRISLQRLNSHLLQRVATVNDRARAEQVPSTVTDLAGGDQERAKVIWMKMRLKHNFPVSFYEVFNPAPGYLTPKPAYTQYLAKFGITGGNISPQPHESSACLYMALAYGADAIGENEAGRAGPTQTIGGVPCYVDSYGEPLVFCRWPVGQNPQSPAGGQSALYTAGYKAGNNDPGDPKGTLQVPTWLSTTNRTTFEALCHAVPSRAAGQPAMSLVLTPVIVSVGRDKALGADLLTLAVTNQGQADDNLYSIDQR